MGKQGEQAMNNHYVLIDYENVHIQSLEKLMEEHFQVHVFLGKSNTKLATDVVLAMKRLGHRGHYVQLGISGKNALDFHIAYYLGRLAIADPVAVYYVISKDTGFDPLLQHMRDTRIRCERVPTIGQMSCFQPVEKPVAVKETPEVKQPTTPRAAAKLKAGEMADRAVINLKKLGSATPKSEKTLKGKIKNWCGKAYSDKEVDAVFNRLVKKGAVKLDGTKVVYQLA